MSECLSSAYSPIKIYQFDPDNKIGDNVRYETYLGYLYSYKGYRKYTNALFNLIFKTIPSPRKIIFVFTGSSGTALAVRFNDIIYNKGPGFINLYNNDIRFCQIKKKNESSHRYLLVPEIVKERLIRSNFSDNTRIIFIDDLVEEGTTFKYVYNVLRKYTKYEITDIAILGRFFMCTSDWMEFKEFLEIKTNIMNFYCSQVNDKQFIHKYTKNNKVFEIMSNY